MMFVDVLYKNIYNCQYFSQLGYTIGKVSGFSSSFSVAQFSLWQKYNYYKKTNDISSHILKGNISCFNISSFNYSRFEEISFLGRHRKIAYRAIFLINVKKNQRGNKE